MPVAIKSQSYVIANEGDAPTFAVLPWANSSHDVRLELRVTTANPRQLTVPHIYVLGLRTVTLVGVTYTYELSNQVCLGLGLLFPIPFTNGTMDYAFYRRKNKIPGAMNITVRQVNLSI